MADSLRGRFPLPDLLAEVGLARRGPEPAARRRGARPARLLGWCARRAARDRHHRVPPRGGGPRAHLSAMVHLYDGRVVAWRCGASPRRRSRRARSRTRSWLGLCERAGVTRSMSRRGHSPNNAAMEGFFGRLKVEMFGGRDWSGWTPDAFAGELAAYICWCNASRIRALREGGRTVWDTTDGRRRRLGTAA